MATKQHLDTLEVTIADSFVISQNKTEEGHGEAKLYVGQRTSEVIKEFFGEPGFRVIFQFKKNDLVRFMNEIKPEYFNPSLPQFNHSGMNHSKNYEATRNDYQKYGWLFGR